MRSILRARRAADPRQGSIGLAIRLDPRGRADRRRHRRGRSLRADWFLIMARYVGAVDQGTTSTRFMVFDEAGAEVARHQIEHRQILPQPGWVEHDPLEIASRVDEAIAGAFWRGNLTGADLAAIGITNQRETTDR